MRAFVMLTSEELQKENEKLKAQIRALEALNKWYEEQLRLNRQKRFGASSEQSKHEESTQLNLFNEAEAERTPLTPEPTSETITYTRKKKAKRGSFAKGLPTEVIEYTLPEEEQTCPKCESPLHVMKKEIREELVIIPAQVKVIQHVTCHYTCRNCEQNDISTPVVKADSPKALIPKSMVSPSLLSYIIHQKFTNAMPLYRQEKDFKRLGVELTRQNLSNWVIQGAALLSPLMLRLKEELLKNEFLHADETTVEVLCEPGRAAETDSYMWLYRTAGNTDKAIVLYDYQQGRSGQYAKNFLEGFKGYLHTDGWGGYHKLEPDIKLCGCWAHARRKFHEAFTALKDGDETSPEAIGLSFCDRLFKIEKYADEKELTPEERLSLREKDSIKLIDEFYGWIEQQEPKTLPKSLLGTAIHYAKNQKVYLTRFLENGNIEISNNRAERSIKLFVIGRKNWLFCNTPNGAKSSATIYSVIQTAIENGLKPFHYLNFVFEHIQHNGTEAIDDILPWSDKAKSASSLS